MKKVIITEIQMKNILNSMVNEGQSGDININSINNFIVNNFNALKKNFVPIIVGLNKLIEMDVLINDTEKYVKNELINVVKNNKTHDQFFTQYSQYLYQTFDKKTEGIGWVKKKYLKNLFKDKNKAVSTINTWQLNNLISSMLFFGSLPEDVNSDWSSNYQHLVDSRKQNLYEKIRNLLVNKIFS